MNQKLRTTCMILFQKLSPDAGAPLWDGARRQCRDHLPPVVMPLTDKMLSDFRPTSSCKSHVRQDSYR